MAYRDRISRTVTRITGAPTAIAAWPVSSVFIGYTATNPATLLGGGTWVQIAQGQMLIGQNPADVDFDTLGDTGGEKAHTLIGPEMPTHDHAAGQLTTTGTGSAHTHDTPIRHLATTTTGGTAERVTDVSNALGSSGSAVTATIAGSTAHTHGVGGDTGDAGGGGAHNNMPPYLTVYIWRRTS